jgi:hypothetical protein
VRDSRAIRTLAANPGVAVPRVTHAVARRDGYLVGCALLSPPPGELLRLLSDRVPG